MKKCLPPAWPGRTPDPAWPGKRLTWSGNHPALLGGSPAQPGKTLTAWPWPAWACIQISTARLLGAEGKLEAPTFQRKPAFWLVNMGQDLVGQGAVSYFVVFSWVFSWLFRGPRFGQNLRVLALEQSSESFALEKKGLERSRTQPPYLR